MKKMPWDFWESPPELRQSTGINGIELGLGSGVLLWNFVLCLVGKETTGNP